MHESTPDETTIRDLLTADSDAAAPDPASRAPRPDVLLREPGETIQEWDERSLATRAVAAAPLSPGDADPRRKPGESPEDWRLRMYRLRNRPEHETP